MSMIQMVLQPNSWQRVLILLTDQSIIASNMHISAYTMPHGMDNASRHGPLVGDAHIQQQKRR